MSADARTQAAGAHSQDCNFSILIIVLLDLMVQDGTSLYT